MNLRLPAFATLAAAAALPLSPGTGVGADPVPPAAVDLGGRRELFVDGYLLDRLDRARLRLHEPRPAGVALKLEKPWEGYHNFGLGVFRDGDGYRMYYRAMPGETFGRHYAAVAVSDDGVTWSRPNLGLVTVGGAAENNVVALEDEGGRLRPASTNLDFWPDTNPDAPPSERWKLVTYQTDGGPHTPGPAAGKDAVHTATFWVSADGFRFRKRDPQPKFSSRLKNSFDGYGRYFWSAAERRYVCYFRWYDTVRTVARATSKDLTTWSDPVPMTYGGTPREHLYENMTAPYFRAPHLYVALATRFMEGRKVLSDEQFRGLKLADFYKDRAGAFNGSPADGVLMTTRAGSAAYDRTFMESFVRPGFGPENWVGRGNYPLAGVIPTGPAEMSMYVMRHYQQPSWHVERMTLRVDGFASLHGPYAGGEAVTKPFTFAGRSLSLNYATGAAGSVRVEVQNAAGRPVEGLSLADADPIVGDEVSRAVTWKGKREVGRLAGQPIRLRLVLKDADVYSLRFEGSEVAPSDGRPGR